MQWNGRIPATLSRIKKVQYGATMLKELQKDFLPVLEERWRALVGESLTNSPMREMLDYHQNTGGKRLRALAVVLAAEPFLRRQGRGWRSELSRLVPIALAVELIHNATLVHDDIQDGDTHRRGKLTLWKKYSMEQAINCGDAFFFLAFQALKGGGYTPELEVFLCRELESATLTVIDGQSREFALKEKLKSSATFSPSEYEEVVRGKTAALFSLPYVCGAKVAGATEAEVDGWREKASRLGVAFQIQDDVLDLWGEKGREKRGMDIAEGKISFPVLELLTIFQERGDAASARWLIELLLQDRESTREADILRAIRLMEENGVKDRCLEMIRSNLDFGDSEAEASFGPLKRFIEESAANQPLRT